MAQPFDAEAVQSTGGAVPIARDPRVLNIVAGDFSASRTGTITYATAARQEADLVWFDRSGRRAEGMVLRASRPLGFRLSHEGQRVAYVMLDDAGREELWIKDAVGSGLPQRFTEPVGNATRAPLWSPVGKELTFYAIPQPGEYGQFRKPVAGGQRTKVVGTRVNGEGADWSRDGRLPLFRQQGQRGGSGRAACARPIAAGAACRNRGLRRQQAERLSMRRPNRTKVPVVQRDHCLHVETLSQRDDGRIGSSQREVAVLLDQPGDARPIVRRGRLDVHVDQASKERRLRLRAKARTHEIGHLRDHERRHDQAIPGIFERRPASQVVGIVLVDDRVERTSINDGEHAPTRQSGSSRHRERCGGDRYARWP
jgi:hypothetical protein